MDNYESTGKLAEGAYGVLYKGICKRTNTPVVIKESKSDSDMSSERTYSMSQREMEILKKLSHPHIITLRDSFVDEYRICLIFEEMQMDLHQYIRHVGSTIDHKLVKSYMHQLCQAIDFCHDNGVMHRDLKPENLLIDYNGLIKVADFGMARYFDPSSGPLTMEVVTLWYRAPEVILGDQFYSSPIDIWSLGCIFAEMVLGHPLVPGNSDIDQLYRIFKLMSTPTEECWPKLKNFKTITFPMFTENRLREEMLLMHSTAFNLLQQTLIYDPEKRITAKNMLEHEYFNNVDASIAPFPK